MTKNDWRKMLRSAPCGCSVVSSSFAAGGMIFFINWFPSFLKEARGFNNYDSGFYASCVSRTALAGGVCGGFFRLASLSLAAPPEPPGHRGFGMATAGVLVNHLLSRQRLSRGVPVPRAAFVATFGGSGGYRKAIELGGTRIGVVFSLMNMAGNFAAAFVNFTAGSLRQRTWRNWDAALFFGRHLCRRAICWAVLNPKEPLFPAPCTPDSEFGPANHHCQCEEMMTHVDTRNPLHGRLPAATSRRPSASIIACGSAATHDRATAYIAASRQLRLVRRNCGDQGILIVALDQLHVLDALRDDALAMPSASRLR